MTVKTKQKTETRLMTGAEIVITAWSVKINAVCKLCETYI